MQWTAGSCLALRSSRSSSSERFTRASNAYRSHLVAFLPSISIFFALPYTLQQIAAVVAGLVQTGLQVDWPAASTESNFAQNGLALP